MLHFAVEPGLLQPHVPFELQLFGGKAYVSLVRFKLERFRTRIAPALGRLLLRPFSDHGFLNLRTYVIHHAEQGIHFITEWLDNRLAVLAGPCTYGLPYRFGVIKRNAVFARQGTLRFDLRVTDDAVHTARSASLDEFLLERYSAFTHHRGVGRVFRIRHKPWLQQPARAELHDTSLIESAHPWFKHAEPVGAHACRDLIGVEISRPTRIKPKEQSVKPTPKELRHDL